MDVTENRGNDYRGSEDIDGEFGLPHLDDDKLPTLESILDEKDTDVYNFEELNVLPVTTEENESDDGTCSIMSEALPPSYVSISDLLKPKKPSIHGSVLRHVILRKVDAVSYLLMCTARVPSPLLTPH